MPDRYLSLDPRAITGTAERLRNRIEDRFADRGIRRVAEEVVVGVRAAGDDADRLARPARGLRWGSRALILVLIALVVVAAVLALDDAGQDAETLQAFDWLSITEAAVNDIVFAALAVFFLWSMEARRKRRAAIAALHRLRSLAHVIDMHQLDKDPERVLGHLSPTAASPTRDLTVDELGRYLDYCSEMLSIVAKAAALYAQASADPLVLDTVAEIENLTVGLSRKIWQKITLLRSAPAG